MTFDPYPTGPGHAVHDHADVRRRVKREMDNIRGKRMKIALHDADKTGFPNLALMKISAFHKAQGDGVAWYDALWSGDYDKVYSSKVFTFTPNPKLYGNVVYGGTGYDNIEQWDTNQGGEGWVSGDGLSCSENQYGGISQPDSGRNNGIRPNCSEAFHGSVCPDYDLYSNLDSSYGFLTRGCPNNCSWCVVPIKEGGIRPESDIEDFLRHDSAVLMDNNVLAHPHGIHQIEKIAKMGIKVDFNQGLDARLIDDSIARLLAKVKWLKPIRLACDRQSQMKHIQKAVTLLRWHNAKPRTYFVYVLVKDVQDAIERVKFLKGMYLDPFAQAYRAIKNPKEPTREQKDFCRWVNHKAVFKSVMWGDYQ